MSISFRIIPVKILGLLAVTPLLAGGYRTALIVSASIVVAAAIAAAPLLSSRQSPGS